MSDNVLDIENKKYEVEQIFMRSNFMKSQNPEAEK